MKNSNTHTVNVCTLVGDSQDHCQLCVISTNATVKAEQSWWCTYKPSLHHTLSCGLCQHFHPRSTAVKLEAFGYV